jgi:hypothetical protein
MNVMLMIPTNNLGRYNGARPTPLSPVRVGFKMPVSRFGHYLSTLDQDRRDFVGHDVELVHSHADSPAALAPRMTCLQVPTPDALIRPSDTKGHLH